MNDENDERLPLIGEERNKIGCPLRFSLYSIVGFCTIFALTTATAILGYLYYYQLGLSCQSTVCSSTSISFFGKYSKTAVATDNIFCSEIGRNVLLKGGNAVDAAIAALFCIGVMNTHSAGIGGGHFMTIYNSTTKDCYVIDARETAPLNASEKMFVNRWNMSQKGWLSIAVPGELHGMWSAYQKFGSGFAWKSLLTPTIELLEEGYPTSHALAKALKDEEERLLKEPTMSFFINPKTKQLYRAGEQIITRNNLTNFFKKLASSADPVQLFYNSSLTEQMVAEFKENGGILTFQDFSSYKSKLYEDDYIIKTKLRNDYQVCGPPPPSGAAVAQAILKVLDEYDMEKKLKTLDPVTFLHRFIEALKFSYAARSELGDINFNKSALSLAKYIASSAHAQKVKGLITDAAHPSSYYGGSFEPVEDHGTTHISVVDAYGNGVSVTSTINLIFGSGVASESTGIIWNDEMDDFSSPGRPNYFGLLPSKANFIVPGKRPMSSASPLITFNPKNPKELFVVGGAGGSKIISGVASVASHVLWLNKNVKEAVDAVRVHNQLTPNTLLYEDNLPEKYVEALKKKGHVMVLGHNLSVITTVDRKDENTLYANSDFRKGVESAPAGY